MQVQHMWDCGNRLGRERNTLDDLSARHWRIDCQVMACLVHGGFHTRPGPFFSAAGAEMLLRIMLRL